ncbi:MAG: DNA repair protein RadA [Chloroflexi bacterium]|nr:MAG: DNA repair protein RadA [Chloroflexota bacterium]
MTRTQTRFVCQQCGYESAKWMGRCPDCGEWNSLVETVITPSRSAAARTSASSPGLAHADAVPLPQVQATGYQRLLTGSSELDRVLGGGVVPGSMVLLAGDPGIGKSSLLLQVAGAVGARGKEVIYVSAEESAQQVKLRAERLGITTERLLLLAETEIELILEVVESKKPALVVVDSIQTVGSASISSAPGSVGQVRDATLRLMRMAKSSQVPMFIIGHVTKEGMVAGPRALEHIVDAVLYLEGERFHSYRLLRGVKNRFGATNEVGVFEMRGEGLVDVPNPSAIFLSEHTGHAHGSAVVVSMEGTRPLLVEVQALATNTAFGTPRCTTNGLDHNRVLMLLAVLTKRVGLALGNQDVYVNVAGGFSLGEPAVDLGVAAAVASSYRERPVAQQTALIGEVGLGGELRSVTHTPARIREAAKLGFKQCILPKSGARREQDPAGSTGGDIQVLRAATLGEALAIAMEY